MGYSKNDMLSQNVNSFPNNNSGQITPADLRDFNANLINSIQFTDVPVQNAVSASYATNASSANSASYAATADATPNAIVGVTSVLSPDTIEIFKGDGTTSTIVIDNVATASYALTASFLEGFVASASYALTASYAANVPLTASYANNATSASYAATASFALNVPATASYATTASYALEAGKLGGKTTGQYVSSVFNPTLPVLGPTISVTQGDGITTTITVDNVASASFATTASFALNAPVINTGSLVTTASFNAYTASINAFTASTNTFTSSIQAQVNGLQSATSSYVKNAQTASMSVLSASYAGYSNNLVSDVQAGLGQNLIQVTKGGVTSTLTVNNVTNATSASYADTAGIANNVVGGLNISASNITVANNLVVNGTASFAYTKTVTGSAVIVGDAFIILNADTPTAPFAGIMVYDTGSASTASLEWNGNNDYWITVEETGASAGILTGASGSKGFEVFPSLNRLTKGTGNNTIIDSNISDNGSIVSINSNTQVTGSLSTTGDINIAQSSKLVAHDIQAANVAGIEINNNTGGTVALFGAGGSTGMTLYGQLNATAFSGSGALVTGVISSSYASNAGAAQTATSASYALTASYASNVPNTASFAVSASFATNATSASYAPNLYNTDGALTGNRQITLDSNTLTLYSSISGSIVLDSPYSSLQWGAGAGNSKGYQLQVTSDDNVGSVSTQWNRWISTSFPFPSVTFANTPWKLDSNGDHFYSGSIYSNGAITAPSFVGTASFATSASVAIISTSASFASTAATAATATSASFATTASYALNAAGGGFPYTGNAVISGSLNISSSVTANNVVTNQTDTYTSTPKIHEIVTLTQAEYNAVSESVDALNTLYIVSGSSSAEFATSASYASYSNNLVSDVQAGLVQNTVAVTKGGVTSNITIDNVGNATSASFATTASYAENAGASFPYTGNAVISGSLNVSTSIGATNLVSNQWDTFSSQPKISSIVTCTQAEYESVSGSADASQTLFIILPTTTTTTTSTTTTTTTVALPGSQFINVSGLGYSSGNLSDSSGNGYTGTVSGGSSATATGGLTALKLTNGKVAWADSVPFDTGGFMGAGTISLWFQFYSQNSVNCLFSKWNDSGNNRGMLLNYRTSTPYMEGAICGTGTCSAPSVGLDFNTTLANNTWYMLTLRSDGTDAKVYINNTETKSASWSNNCYNNTSPFNIGFQQDGGDERYAPIFVGQFIMWKSAVDVTTIWNATKSTYGY